MRSLRNLQRRAIRLVVLAAAAMASTGCLAAVTTIHEGGPTVPIGQYLAAFFAQEPAASHNATPAEAGALPMTFPIATQSMRPGRLQAPVHLRTAGWLAAPMFIVGDDPESRQWLAANRDKLRRVGASGLVVNVASIEAFRSLRAVAPDVPMAPGSIEELARQAGLSIYPLFVTADGQVTQLVP
jgi:integrating conjugative element protein (TIGR03765 family)